MRTKQNTVHKIVPYSTLWPKQGPNATKFGISRLTTRLHPRLALFDLSLLRYLCNGNRLRFSGTKTLCSIAFAIDVSTAVQGNCRLHAATDQSLDLSPTRLQDCSSNIMVQVDNLCRRNSSQLVAWRSCGYVSMLSSNTQWAEWKCHISERIEDCQRIEQRIKVEANRVRSNYKYATTCSTIDRPREIFEKSSNYCTLPVLHYWSQARFLVHRADDSQCGNLSLQSMRRGAFSTGSKWNALR